MTLDDYKTKRKVFPYGSLVVMPEDTDISFSQWLAEAMIGSIRVRHSIDKLDEETIANLYIKGMELGTVYNTPVAHGRTVIIGSPDVEELSVTLNGDILVSNCPRLKKITINRGDTYMFHNSVSMIDCHMLETVSFNQFESGCVGTLTIQGCPVKKITDGITVTDLMILNNDGITMLPNVLTVLNKLLIYNCAQFSDLNMAVMDKLDISLCPSFTGLDDEYGSMLRKLSITHCDNLTYLPTTMCIRNINLYECRGLTALPSSIVARKVDIRGCVNLLTANAYGNVKQLIINEQTGLYQHGILPAGPAVESVKFVPYNSCDSCDDCDGCDDESYDDFEE